MLSSKHFFSEHAFRQRIKSPVEFVLGAVQPSVTVTSPPQPLVRRMEVMGQNLFAPPNVKGWPGGQAWLNTSTVLARVQLCSIPGHGRPVERHVARRRGIHPVFEPPVDPGGSPKSTCPKNRRRRTSWMSPGSSARPRRPSPKKWFGFSWTPSCREASANPPVPSCTAFVADGKPTGEALDRRVREAGPRRICRCRTTSWRKLDPASGRREPADGAPADLKLTAHARPLADLNPGDNHV